MKRNSGMLFAGILLSATFAGYAQDTGMNWSGRIGPTIGTYKGEVAIRATDGANGAVLLNENFEGDEEFAYGLQTGLTAGYGKFFADLGIEWLQVDFRGEELDRTDAVLSIGYRVGAYGSLFTGVRKSTQGDGIFDDETFDEFGPFIGAGLGGMPAGPVLFGASVAYNFSQVDDFPSEGEELDYEGFSIKLSASPKSAPNHSVQLRFQQFDGDDSVSGDVTGDGVDDDVEFELEETYLQLYYLYAFPIGS